MAAYDDLDVKRIFLVGIISVVVTAVTALAVQVMYYNLAQWQQSETAAASNYQRQLQILDEQTQQISTYGVDADTGNITIPIDKAIELMVSEQKTQNSSNASTSGPKSNRDDT